MPPEEEEGRRGIGRVALGCHVVDDATAYVEVDAAGAQPISNVRYPL